MKNRHILFASIACMTVCLGADKEAGGGTGKKTDLELLEEARDQVKALSTERDAAVQAKIDAEKIAEDALAAQQKSEQERDAALKAKDEADKAKADAIGAKDKALADLKLATEAKDAAEKAKADAESATAIAQTKANETAAKAGLKPPFTTSAKEEGSKQAGQDTSLTGRARAVAYFEKRQPAKSAE